MLDKKISKLLNEQIQKELYSAYLYLEMANYYSEQGLDGFENWFYVQNQEEVAHAMLIRTYMLNNDEKVKLLPIEAPKSVYKDFDGPLKKSYEHEQTVTASINSIYAVAYEKKDFRTMEFLNWFIKEQGEEEKNANDLIQKYELFGKDSKGLYSIDQELASRTYTAPDLVLD